MSRKGVAIIVPPGGTIKILPVWSTMNNRFVSSGASTSDKGDTIFSAITCKLDCTLSTFFFFQFRPAGRNRAGKIIINHKGGGFAKDLFAGTAEGFINFTFNDEYLQRVL